MEPDTLSALEEQETAGSLPTLCSMHRAFNAALTSPYPQLAMLGSTYGSKQPILVQVRDKKRRDIMLHGLKVLLQPCPRMVLRRPWRLQRCVHLQQQQQQQDIVANTVGTVQLQAAQVQQCPIASVQLRARVHSKLLVATLLLSSATVPIVCRQWCTYARTQPCWKTISRTSMASATC